MTNQSFSALSLKTASSRFLFFITGMALLLFSPALLMAQSGGNTEGSGGWETGTSYNKLYDSQTLSTFEGKVVSIEKIIPDDGMSYGVNMLVKSGRKTISVHLGPSWYIDNQDFTIEPKDKVVVSGSLVRNRKNEYIMANEISLRNRVLKLRDEAGHPVWSGWSKN